MTEPKFWKCHECSEIHENQFQSCWKCGANRSPECDDVSSIPAPVFGISDEADLKFEHIILTTAQSISGYNVKDTIQIITSECVYGLNAFSDFFASMTDTFGGRSNTTQNALKELRLTCLQELKREAARIGADAVIAVDLDYNEFSGKNKSMLFLVASGTAVKIEKQ